MTPPRSVDGWVYLLDKWLATPSMFTTRVMAETVVKNAAEQVAQAREEVEILRKDHVWGLQCVAMEKVLSRLVNDVKDGIDTGLILDVIATEGAAAIRRRSE